MVSATIEEASLVSIFNLLKSIPDTVVLLSVQ